MKIDIYERFFVGLAIALLVVFFAAMVVSAFGSAVVLTNPANTIDPTLLDSTPPFNETGVRELAPGRYEVIMIASTFQFTPGEIRVPAGSEVTFRITSRDVIHGIQMTEIPFNFMLVPGQVTQATVRFGEPGEHLLICHEYCGTGHQVMYGKVIVEAATTAQGEP